MLYPSLRLRPLSVLPKVHMGNTRSKNSIATRVSRHFGLWRGRLLTTPVTLCPVSLWTICFSYTISSSNATRTPHTASKSPLSIKQTAACNQRNSEMPSLPSDVRTEYHVSFPCTSRRNPRPSSNCSNRKHIPRTAARCDRFGMPGRRLGSGHLEMAS
jgi:hypothetical protein